MAGQLASQQQHCSPQWHLHSATAIVCSLQFFHTTRTSLIGPLKTSAPAYWHPTLHAWVSALSFHNSLDYCLPFVPSIRGDSCFLDLLHLWSFRVPLLSFSFLIWLPIVYIKLSLLNAWYSFHALFEPLLVQKLMCL